MAEVYNSRRIVIRGMLVAVFLLATGANIGAWELCDDFEDRNIKDKSPISWGFGFPQFPGTYDASSGDLVVSGSTGDTLAIVWAWDVHVNDVVSMRSRVKLQGTGDSTAWISVRGNLAGKGSGYFGTIGTSEMYILSMKDGVVETLDSGQLPVGGDPDNQEFMVQLDVSGDGTADVDLQLRVWAPGEPFPVAPLLEVTDMKTDENDPLPASDKGLGVGTSANGETDVVGTFRFIEASDAMIIDDFHGCFTEPSPINQKAGDCNQDGRLDIADIICTLKIAYPPGFFMLDRTIPEPPCSSGDDTIAVLDVDGNGQIGISDVVYMAQYLFRGGNAPVQGLGCVQLTSECQRNPGC